MLISFPQLPSLCSCPGLPDRLNGRHVAVKFADCDKRFGEVCKRKNEVAAYQALQPLQGIYIPRLEQFGYVVSLVVIWSRLASLWLMLPLQHCSTAVLSSHAPGRWTSVSDARPRATHLLT